MVAWKFTYGTVLTVRDVIRRFPSLALHEWPGQGCVWRRPGGQKLEEENDHLGPGGGVGEEENRSSKRREDMEHGD